MKIPYAASTAAAVFLAVLVANVEGLGSAATVAIVASSGTVCGVLADFKPRSIQCARVGQPAFSVLPNISFSSVSGGRNFFCGLRSGGLSFFCWTVNNSSSVFFPVKRLYKGSVELTDLSVGEDQICAAERNTTGKVSWWRNDGTFSESVAGDFVSLTSGRKFSCGIGNSGGGVLCWGGRGAEIQQAFANISMISIVAGDSHVCGITKSGFLICKGLNSSGQLNAPSGRAFEFSGLALGVNHSCAIKQPNGTVICWGGGAGGRSFSPANATMFETIVAGGDLTCGLITVNFTVLCWKADNSNPPVTVLPLPKIIPGICVQSESSCKCGVFPDSESLCSDSGVICKSCATPLVDPPPASAASPSPATAAQPPDSPPSPSKISKGWLAFAIIGSVGSLAGLCTILYCIWIGIFRHKKVHNSVQPTIAAAAATTTNPVEPSSITIHSPFTSPSGSKSRIFRRHGSRIIRRQRSGPSSFKERAQVFSFADLAAATKNFSLELKIGAGSFGTVYKGKLSDGREVAIKRSESSSRAKKLQEKESAFQSELAFLSRLHHKHLVGFVGYCEEREERLLVYEYMKNGALYDHLHARAATAAAAAAAGKLNSWGIRIKVLLDASRGIDYLHSYAVPPIIHRDIKSSNILLDSEWVARVSDFGLSLMGPEVEGGHLSIKAAGTMGYMDPEYYGLQHLTTKSDVYGFGVVMLEVLTGRRAIFRDGENCDPVSVVDYAVARIAGGEIGQVLDHRVPTPGTREAEALELVAYTAVHCVSLEGKDRPTMADVVMNLESALALCEASGNGSGSRSSNSISFASLD